MEPAANAEVDSEGEVDGEVKEGLEALVKRYYSAKDPDDEKDRGYRHLGDYKQKFESDTRQYLADAIETAHPALKRLISTHLGGDIFEGSGDGGGKKYKAGSAR